MSQTTIDQDILDLLQSIEYEQDPHAVILYNDETHTMEQVAEQLIKALDCDVERACIIMLQAHFFGKSTVIKAPLAICEPIAKVLGEINLSVDVIPVVE